MISYIKKRLVNYYTELMNCPGRIEDVAGGFAIGIFIAFSPWVGLHTALVLLLAVAFRKSLAAGVLGALVFNPATAFFIFSAEYELGRLILGAPHVSPPEKLSLDMQGLKTLYDTGASLFYPLLLGSLLLGLGFAVMGYYIIRRSLAAYRDRVYLKKYGFSHRLHTQ